MVALSKLVSSFISSVVRAFVFSSASGCTPSWVASTSGVGTRCKCTWGTVCPAFGPSYQKQGNYIKRANRSSQGYEIYIYMNISISIITAFYKIKVYGTKTNSRRGSSPMVNETIIVCKCTCASILGKQV
eukprot:GHVR01114835.1.p1 GENE.GHVR01114835.1~~GHVR01114835.1.p1  ORF type:complete len:130 (+),score=6.36 GHVR01114835.1:345-734(+)